MKAQVDHDLCEGHGKCAMAAPEVFDFHEDEDQSYVKIDEVPARAERQGGSGDPALPATGGVVGAGFVTTALAYSR